MKARIDWVKVDPYLLQACMLPTEEDTAAALRRLAEKRSISMPSIYRRLRFLKLRRIEANMGPKALRVWEKHCKAVSRLYKNALYLHALVVNREREVAGQIKKVATRSYSAREVARFLGVGPGTVEFFADVLQKLQRDENGKFSGQELMRFCEENSYLLSGKRLLQRNETRKRAGA